MSLQPFACAARLTLAMAFGFFVLFAQVTTAAAPASRPAEAPHFTLVKTGRLLDVKAGRYVAGAAVLVEGERIKLIGALADVQSQAPADTTVIDLGSSTILPGLIDCHTHLLDERSVAMNFYEGAAIRILQGRQARQALWGAAAGRQVLQVGFTTVRDMGDSGGNGDAALRDAIEDGWVVGPRILAVTKKLAPPGGQHLYVQAESAKALIGNEYLIVGRPEDGPDAVREAIHIGADWIKVIADDGRRTLRVDEMKAIVEEAHRLKFKVAAHAHTAEGVRVSVEAGVDSVEHAYQVSDESLKMMRDKGIWLVPTDLTPEACHELIDKTIAPEAEQPPEQEEFVKEQVEYAPERFARARKFEVKMAAGSDNAFIWPGKTRGQADLLMFDAYMRAGLTPIEIIRMATVNAAELLGREESIGTIEPGKYADLIAVTGDPLRDAGELKRVTFVMKSGAVVDLKGRYTVLPEASKRRG